MKNFRDAALASALNMVIVVGFICLVVWWMSTNFGAISALATVGGLVMASVLYAGVRIGGSLVRDAQRTALENFTDGLAAVEDSRGKHANVERENARAWSAQQIAGAKITVLDYQHQLRQDERERRMLTDARQQWEMEQAQQPAQVFAMVDDNNGAGPTYYDE